MYIYIYTYTYIYTHIHIIVMYVLTAPHTCVGIQQVRSCKDLDPET